MQAWVQKTWRTAGAVAPWFSLEPWLPGSALFALLVLLSYRFVADGFAQVRQHAFTPDGARGTLTIRATRNWWSCTCRSAGECACFEAVTRGIRRCCGLLAGTGASFGGLTFEPLRG